MREKLKKARKTKNLFQRDIAQYLGMATKAYQRIEVGARGTSEDNWLKLNELFGEEFPLPELMKNS